MKGRLRLLLWSLVLAVSALSAVGFFADRVQSALDREGANVLAADLVVEQGRPIPEQWREQAHALGLRSARIVSFPSVVFLGEEPQLVQVKAVEEGYPLRGDLRIRREGNTSQQPPVIGEAVLGQRLAYRSEEASIELGQLQLRVVGELLEEPDVGANLFQLAPRLLINWADAQASGLLGPASRARHRLLLAGDAAQLRAFRAWLKPRLPQAASLLDSSGGRPELSSAIDRGHRFLSLAALCASLVAGVAIMLATRRFAEQVLDEAAILRTLGMTSRQVLRRYLSELMRVAVLGVLLGAAIGYLAQALLAWLLADWLGSDLPAAGWRPLPIAFGHALILVLGFALPGLLAIRKVPALRVLRRDIGAPGLPQWLAVLVALGAYTALVWWQVDDAQLAGLMSLGLLLVLAVFAAAAWLLLRLLRPLRRQGGLGVGLAALSRRPGLTLMQLSGFGLAITLLLLLSVVRLDILSSWQASLPPDAPNHFLINIQPDEVAAIDALLQAQGITGSGFYPTTRGRLKQINQREVQPEAYSSSRARRLAAREFSLGFGEQLQADNRVLQGRWWQADEAGFSLEQGLAEELGIGIGDELSFDVAGQRISAPVLSMRSVAWDSFNVNFFVQGSAALLDGLPHAVITSIHLGDGSEPILRELAREHPAVSVISIGPLLEKVRGVIERGALAIEGVFLFTLGAALLVSAAAVQVSREERQREIAVLRAFGASQRRVLGLVLGEFLTLGLLAGVLSAGLANLLGALLAQRLFELPASFSPLLWLVGCGVGMLGVGLVGYLASRSVLRTSPMQVLR